MERLGGFCRAVLARPLQQGCLQCAHGINMPRTRRGCTDVIGRFDATASMACSGPASEGGTAVFIKGDGNHGRAVTDVVQGMGETAHHLSFLCRVIPRLLSACGYREKVCPLVSGVGHDATSSASHTKRPYCPSHLIPNPKLLQAFIIYKS